MKKGLLFAGTILVSASAFAAPVDESLPTRAFSADRLTQMATPVVKDQVRYSAPKKIVTPDNKFNITPVIQIPQTPFYGEGLKNDKGSFAPVQIPANVPVKYKGGAVATRAEGVTDRFSDWNNIKYEWNYRNPITWEESNDWIAAEQIAVTYAQISDLGTFPMPDMIASYGEEVEETAAPYKILLSGKPLVPLMGENGVELTDLGNTTVPTVDGITWEQGSNYSPEALFGYQTFSDKKDLTYTQATIDKAMNNWATPFKNTTGETLKEMKIKGIGQALPYAGSPYLLSSLTLYAYLWTDRDLEFELALYEMDENYQPTDSLIYKSTFTVEANADIPTHKPEQIRMDLQHKDADGWTMNYVVIDRPVFLKISGFEDNSSVQTFEPIAPGYDYDSPYCYYVDTTACVIYDMIGEKEATISDYACYNQGAWGSDVNGYYFHHSFWVDVEAEYPILQPTDYYIGDAEGVTMEYAEDGIYTVNLEEEGITEVAVIVSTSADDIDEIVIDVEEGEIPAWIEQIGVFNGIKFQTQSGAYLNLIELHFAIKGDYTGEEFYIPLNYKTQNIKVGVKGKEKEPEGAVDNIYVDGDASYYDLQGRKLNAAPEKGIYIKKEGSNVSKVIL